MPELKQSIHTNKENRLSTKIPLTPHQRSQFKKSLKAGIYKELYQKNLLTSRQLTCLLNCVNPDNNPTNNPAGTTS